MKLKPWFAAVGAVVCVSSAAARADDAPSGYICRARNALGRVFTAQADTQAEASAQALELCQEYSAICYSTSCDPVQAAPTEP
jgi:hypothetical protein